ncbi:MAG TPA: hypothetical protein VME46_06050 [Acidimicrobiales bacterium]|nr:hypothetical protein [Acidimicrobiales bacterium]
MGADLEKCSSCMRSNGVANVAYPVISGQGASLKLTPAVASEPKFNAARDVCQKYLPPGSSSEQATTQDQAAYLRAATCMRSHGTVGFPDPVFSGGSVGFPLPKGMDPNSPSSSGRETSAKMLMPAGLPFGKQAESGR